MLAWQTRSRESLFLRQKLRAVGCVLFTDGGTEEQVRIPILKQMNSVLMFKQMQIVTVGVTLMRSRRESFRNLALGPCLIYSLCTGGSEIEVEIPFGWCQHRMRNPPKQEHISWVSSAVGLCDYMGCKSCIRVRGKGCCVTSTLGRHDSN